MVLTSCRIKIYIIIYIQTRVRIFPVLETTNESDCFDYLYTVNLDKKHLFQPLKAHSHRARLRRYETRAKRPACSYQVRLRPSTGVDALKIERCSILSASTPDDGRRGAWYERAGLLARVSYRRRRARCEWAFSG